MAVNKNESGAAAGRSKRFWKRFCTAFGRIHLVDKCLLILMVILLSQSAYVLLTDGGSSAGSNHIDVIVRTASASIFGYFLSANFVQRTILSKPKAGMGGRSCEVTNKSTGQSEAPQNRIGFSTPVSGSEPEQGNAGSVLSQTDDEKVPAIGRLQIITAAVIALFCLVTLILVRDMAGYEETANAATAAVVSQFRDFVSGCVGFLIGCPTPKTGSE